MFITRKHLSRRTALKGLGVSIGLPLLDAMIPAGTALAKTAAVPVTRMGFIYFPHGAVMANWQPKATGKDFAFSRILKPLEPYRSHVTVVTGLRNKGGESSDPHGIMEGTWLSCYGPLNRSESSDEGVSADQFAARVLGKDTTLPSLEIAGEGGVAACSKGAAGCGFGSSTAFRTPLQPLPMEVNPRKVFFTLFGRGDTMAERKEILSETGSVLDYAMEQAAALKQTVGPADRRIVNDYFDSVREVEQRVQKMGSGQLSKVKIPNAPLGIPEDFGQQLSLMFEMMALAYQANVTRVVSFLIAKEVTMRTYNQIGVPDAYHPISHHQNDPVKLEKITKIQTYHTQMFAQHLVKRLAAMPDGDGSMLDHSIILFGSNMSNSDLHNNDPLPSAVVGLGCGRIKGGQHLHYPQDTPHANLLLTLLDRAGIHRDSLGNSTGTFAEV